MDTGGTDSIQNDSAAEQIFSNSEIKAVTNKLISVRARSCRHLTSINLRGCGFISDVDILAIAERCHYLTSINLMHCYSISDIGILAIAERCHHLSSINLMHCYSISDIGILAIAEGCHHLTSISFLLCYKISAECASALSRSYPRLQFYR